jgi:hypothetical protein
VEENEKPTSEFNDAFGFLGRINTLWYACHTTRQSDDMKNYHKQLVSIYLELSSDMTNDKRDSIRIKLREIERELNNIRYRRGGAYMPVELIHDLEDIEEALREVYDKAGLKTKRKDEYGA